MQWNNSLYRKISRESKVETVAWLLLRVFSQIYAESQEQKAQKDDLNHFGFGQKKSPVKFLEK